MYKKNDTYRYAAVVIVIRSFKLHKICTIYSYIVIYFHAAAILIVGDFSFYDFFSHNCLKKSLSQMSFYCPLRLLFYVISVV